MRDRSTPGRKPKTVAKQTVEVALSWGYSHREAAKYAKVHIATAYRWFPKRSPANGEAIPAD